MIIIKTFCVINQQWWWRPVDKKHRENIIHFVIVVLLEINPFVMVLITKSTLRMKKLNVDSHDNVFNNYPMIIMKYDEITIPWLLRSLLGLIHVRSFVSILRHLYVLSYICQEASYYFFLVLLYSILHIKLRYF